jgi:predicted dehydrogenase
LDNLSDQEFRVGVVGLGSFGQHHVRHMARNPDAVLTGVSDIDPERARATAAAYGCQVFANAADMAGAVDAVSVVAPATVHHTIAAAMLDAGIHVLVEKPLATSRASGQDLIDRAVRSNVILQVGHVERFSPAIIRLGALSTDPRRITCVRRSPWTGRSGDVDVILDMMIHDIDHVLVLADSPVVSVAASGRSLRSGHIDEAEAWLTFQNGLTATLSANRVADAPLRQLTVTQSDRIFVADLSGPTLSVGDRRISGDSKPVPLPENDNLGDEISAFINSASGKSEVLVDGHAGLAALDIALRIQAALSEERESQLEFVKP